MKSSANFPKITILSATAALAGGGLGWALRPAVQMPAKPTSPPISLRENSPLGRHRMQTSTRQRIDALNLAGTPAAQCLAVLAFLEIESVSEIRDLLENARFFPPHAAEFLAIQTLLRRWLELEPETAMEYCRVHQPKTLPDLLVNYAATHPAEAGRLASAVPAGYWTGLTWRRLCLGVAAKDPEAAWAMLQRTPKDAEHEAAKAVGKLVTLDLAGAPARIEQLPDSLRAYAKAALAIEMMKADPITGWAWILRQPKPGLMLHQAIGQTLKTDPAKALELLGSLPPEMLTEAGQWMFLYNIREAAGTAGTLAASSLNPAFKQTLAAAFFDDTKYRDPKGSMAFLVQCDSKTQAEKIPPFLSHWFNKDPAAAKEWRDALPEGPLRDAASTVQEPAGESDPAKNNTPAAIARQLNVGNYLSPQDARLAELTPVGVGEIMATLSERTHDYFLKSLAQQNPAAVTGWLETVTLTNESGPYVAEFLMEWAGKSPADAASWVGKLPDGDVARTAAVNVARQYQRYAPAAAQAWVDSLPAGPVQDYARKGLAKP
jgi:hypothetical protein